MVYVYILESTVDGTLYAGQTTDLVGRIQRHNRGGVQATKNRIPYKLVYYEVYGTRAEAMWREWELKKKWNTARKKRLIKSFDQKKLNSIPGLWLSWESA